MNEVQQRVQEAIEGLVESGVERGIQVAVYHHGEPLVEAIAGVADPASGRLVRPDTPFYNFSIVKGAAATIAHILVDRGVFGYDTPVAKIWPEFGARGKQAAADEGAGHILVFLEVFQMLLVQRIDQLP